MLPRNPANALISTLLLLVAPLGAALAVGGAPAAAPAGPAPLQEGDDPRPILQTEDEFIINFAESTKPDEAMTLEQFVKICQEATGDNFTYTNETRNLLQSSQVRMFGTKRIPKRDFYRFFQIMMFINEFACVEVGPEHLKVIVIQSLAQATGRQTIKNRAIYVLPDDLEDYADQPAVLITTVLTLPNTDVRQLTTSLRPLMPDQSTQSMLNAGSSNSLILTGFGSNIVHLARLLRIIDEASAVPEDTLPVFDVIPLEFAGADDVADIVEQLLEASRQAVEAQARNRPRGAEQGPSGQLNRQSQGEAKILTYPRTNSLLVMAMPDDLPRIKDLVARLDVDVVEPERNYHVYALENVNADDIAEVLDDFLRDASRIAQQTGPGGRSGQQGGQSNNNDNEVVVVPEPGTNSLLIAASKTRFEEVEDLIVTLDQRQDQVLIETALIELTGTNVRDIGVELGAAQDIPPTGSDTGQFGVTNFGLSTFTDTDGDQIPDARVPSLASGITAGILDGEDFALPILLAALETRDDTNVLNIPSVLVNNNGSATVSTLDERPTTTLTATGGLNGQTQENFNNFQESGTTLSISPSISASRYLRLGVELTVSTFVGAGTSTVPPPRITRSINTTVSVPDGDTMVIGGIVTDNLNENESYVPFLGELPIVKYLFRRKADTHSVTTLYFFVTPHILHDDDFADLAEVSYMKKLRAAEVIGKHRVRLVDPDFGVEDDSAGLRVFELPLYRSPGGGETDTESLGLDPVRRNQLLEQARARRAARVSTSPSEDLAPALPDGTLWTGPAEDGGSDMDDEPMLEPDPMPDPPMMEEGEEDPR